MSVGTVGRPSTCICSRTGTGVGLFGISACVCRVSLLRGTMSDLQNRRSALGDFVPKGPDAPHSMGEGENVSLCKECGRRLPKYRGWGRPLEYCPPSPERDCRRKAHNRRRRGQ